MFQGTRKHNMSEERFVRTLSLGRTALLNHLACEISETKDLPCSSVLFQYLTKSLGHCFLKKSFRCTHLHKKTSTVYL